MQPGQVLFLFSFSRAVIGVGVEEEDRKHTWLDDAGSVSEHVIIICCDVIVPY